MSVALEKSGKVSPELLMSERIWSQQHTPVRHIEYTVTHSCYLIQHDIPCLGCSSVMGKTEPTTHESNMRVRINHDLVIDNIRTFQSKGYNIVTLNGGEPLDLEGFEKVVSWIASESTITGIIPCGRPEIFLGDKTEDIKIDKSNFQLSGLDYERYKVAGLFDIDKFGYLRISSDYLLLTPEEVIAQIKDNPKSQSQAKRSYFGLIVADLLAAQGTPPTIHMVIRNDNINQVIPMYEWAKSKGIRFSIAPLVYNWESAFYESQDQLEANNPFRLTEDHKPQLSQIAKYLYDEALYQISSKLPRLVVPSSVFLKLLPEHGWNNSANCFPIQGITSLISRFKENDNPKRLTDLVDVDVSGDVSACVKTFMTVQKALKCRGCFGSAAIDRDNGYSFAEIIKEGYPYDFVYGEDWRKNPNKGTLPSLQIFN